MTKRKTPIASVDLGDVARDDEYRVAIERAQHQDDFVPLLRLLSAGVPLQSFLLPALADAMRGLTQPKTPGAKPKLTPTQRGRIVTIIEFARRKGGITVDNACHVLATRYGVSHGTIKRIWDGRPRPKRAKPP